jgi:uncharacterized membrane protein
MENNRILSIDVTRGIVMIIMALDHVRDYMHVNSVTQNPVNLFTTSSALFFTRWITHICAPTFVFLAGTSAYLLLKRSNSIAATRKFLLTRGIWLIILELTLVNFALWFDLHFRTIIFEVISAIGIGFILLSLLLNLSTKTIAIIGVAITALHALFPLLPLSESSAIRNILSPLFLPGAKQVTNNLLIVFSYPPIPWFGIMLCGFASGNIFNKDSAERKKTFIRISLLLASLFIIIRFINIYGDPAPWTVQKNGLFSFLSYINISKYPPSLLFSLLTLSITYTLLFVTEGKNNALTRLAKVFGSVPLFYFVVHLYIIHIITIAMVMMQGYHWNNLLFSNFQLGRPVGKSGLPLAGIYTIWLLLLLLLYPICKWYGHYKKSHAEKTWLRYL